MGSTPSVHQESTPHFPKTLNWQRLGPPGGFEVNVLEIVYLAPGGGFFKVTKENFKKRKKKCSGNNYKNNFTPLSFIDSSCRQ